MQKMRNGNLITAVCMACLVPGAYATAAEPAAVKADLLADTAAVVPGKPFTVGVLLTVKPGWHVYWKHPGDAGLATEVTWTVPDGFKAGPLQWPTPIRFAQPGNIVGYGYEGSALLMAKVTPPRVLREGSRAAIGAEVSWLGCKDVCVPGGAKVQLTLPVANAATAANARRFTEWRHRLPVGADAAESPATVTVTGALGSGSGSGTFTVNLEWIGFPKGVEWFPAPEAALAISNVAVVTDKRRTRIAFTAALLRGHALGRNLVETVVGYTDAQGRRRGVHVPIPLRRPTAKELPPA